MKSDGTAL